MITLRLDKLYSRERTAQPCSVSIPLAQGRLKASDPIRLWQNGMQLPMQKKVLSVYPDGSVRYLFLRFLADIPANKGTLVECDLFGEKTYARETEPAGRLMCVPQENGFCVDTGKLKFTVINHGAELFGAVTAFGKNYLGKQFAGPTLTSEKASYQMQYGEWSVIEEGPVCVILSNQGKFVAGEAELLCEARITAYAGKPYAEVEFRLVNATEEAVSMTSWEYAVAVENRAQEQNLKIRTCVAESNYKTDFVIGEAGETVEKSITAEFLLNQSNEQFAETYYGTFFADYTTEEGGICATVYQAHQNFPKAVLAGKDGLVVKLIPEGSEPAVLQPGMAIKQKLQLLFHTAEEELQEINHQSIMFQMPDQPIVPSEVYEASGLFPDVFVKKERQNPEVECALIMSADIHTRSYGMMNWGDAPDPGYTAQGRGQGSLVWTNNEYDYPHACMVQFVRTGIRRFLDYCLVSGTHQRDVDICHYSKNPLLQGGQWEHTKGHCVNGVIVCSHQWVEGILDCYHLTGDERFYDAAIGIGENVLRLLDTPEYQKIGGLNARETGWALRTLTALYRETFDKKWTEKCDWIVGQFKEWADTYGGWLAPYTDNTVIRVPFMISVAIGSLMRYYREFPRDDIREMIVRAVDDMTENCLMDIGYFYYKELPSLRRIGNNALTLEAMAIAYELTGKKKYLEIGKKTFQNIVNNSLALGNGTGKRMAENALLVGTTATKRFAQMLLPMLTYYAAVAEAGLLETEK